jgi:hypothetical protein
MAKSDPEIDLARLRLSTFVRGEARRTANELGFGWRPATITPSGPEGLRTELQTCHKTGLPFRVLRDFSHDTIFDGPATNWAMRFWHDTRHVWLGADFGLDDEMLVASCHLARAREEGLGPGTLEYSLLFADTVGQTIYVDRTHSFVIRQLDFALDYLHMGLDAAIERGATGDTFEKLAP